MSYRVARLGRQDIELARPLFTMMADVFEEECAELADAYIARLLAREDTWVIAAYDGTAAVGGITAHALPMTRAEASELFIYDLAVRRDHQRRGVGRSMLDYLRRTAAKANIDVVFVAADADDRHAIEFYRAVSGLGMDVRMFTFGVGTTPRE